MQKQESVLESSVMRRTLSAVLLLLALAGAGCAQNRIVYAQSGVQVQPPQYPSYQGSYTNGAIPSAWLPLYQRLRADGLDGPDLPALFASMGTPSQDPMGRKIKELYTKAVLKAHNARPAQAAGLSRRDHRRERGEMPGLP